MNNSQFRKLLFDDTNAPSPRDPAVLSTLGTKKQTTRPRGTLSDLDFARKVREQHAAFQPSKGKQQKSSAPKGSKFNTGYVDRAKARREAGRQQDDDQASRITALEEQVKLGQLDQDTFESLRDEIIEADTRDPAVVEGSEPKEQSPPVDVAVDVDAALDKLQEQAIQTVQKEKMAKKGTVASPASVVGVKRSRDEILAEMKAQRRAVAEARLAAEPSLNGKWHKVGEDNNPKIEIDRKGREVLITIDEEGNIKKKVRKVPLSKPMEPDTKRLSATTSSPPALDAPPLGKGGEVDDDDDEDDIFQGAGTEYNPLAADEDEDGDSSDEEDAAPKPSKPPPVKARTSDSSGDDTSSEPASAPRNYFNDAPTVAEETKEDRFKGIEGFLKKAAQMGATAVDPDDDETRDESKEARDARLARQAKMLANDDRDEQDMDLGFGTSRYDEEDAGSGDEDVRLSEWKDAGADDGPGGGKKGGVGKKKQRKAKKRKGDANNFGDIMRVIEGRKAKAAKS